MANGALKIYDAFVAGLKARNLPVAVELKEESKGSHISKSGCQGFCQMGPLVTINPDGIMYTRVKPEDVEEIIEKTILKNEAVERLLYVNPADGKHCRGTGDIPFYKKQMRFVLKNCGVIDPEDIREYIANDGYKAAEKAFTSMSASGNVFKRRAEMKAYIAETPVGKNELRQDVETSAEYSARAPQDERIFSEEEITRVLALTGKADVQQQLNCGACGYDSCRKKAIAVLSGMQEEMKAVRESDKTKEEKGTELRAIRAKYSAQISETEKSYAEKIKAVRTDIEKEKKTIRQERVAIGKERREERKEIKHEHPLALIPAPAKHTGSSLPRHINQQVGLHTSGCPRHKCVIGFYMAYKNKS